MQLGIFQSGVSFAAEHVPFAVSLERRPPSGFPREGSRTLKIDSFLPSTLSKCAQEAPEANGPDIAGTLAVGLLVYFSKERFASEDATTSPDKVSGKMPGGIRKSVAW